MTLGASDSRFCVSGLFVELQLGSLSRSSEVRFPLTPGLAFPAASGPYIAGTGPQRRVAAGLLLRGDALRSRVESGRSKFRVGWASISGCRRAAQREARERLIPAARALDFPCVGPSASRCR